ncbi:MAG: hypothetical protein L3J93_02515 [Thermoplasmata archaeon]|nr:hypothetical protein [Thermoplasmata archaeon]
MPIVLDPATWSRERLLGTLRDHREALEETRGLLARPDLKELDPASLRTARELVESVLLLTDRLADDPGLPVDLLARVVNVQYDALLAAIDLMKSHADVPKVPAPRRPSAPLA